MTSQNPGVPVADVGDVPEGGAFLVWLDAEPVALFKLNGCIHATSDNCSHGGGSLSEGSVCGENIECPLHQGQFHIPTGKAVGGPCVDDVRTYPVHIADGKVFVTP